MKTALVMHTDCFSHQGQQNYQEIPDRLHVVLRALEHMDLLRLEAPLAREADLRRVHSKAHIEKILQTVKRGAKIELDYDTALDCFTANAALRATGAACHALDGIMEKKFSSAFCAVRPPGHHAEPEKAMGFCYFSSVAIAALRAREHYGLTRVAVVDFDVHHGNGTQAALSGIDGTYFASLHQHPHYPNTGHSVDTPNIRNIPLPAGTSARHWRNEFEHKVITDLHEFKPEIIFVSAGFDAHKDDPLGEFLLADKDYAWLGQQLTYLANTYAKGRLISMLEGGYNLSALASSAAAYVEAL